MSTPEFDQATIDRVAAAIYAEHQRDWAHWPHEIETTKNNYSGMARAALVAAMQPEPCEPCRGTGTVTTKTMDATCGSVDSGMTAFPIAVEGERCSCCGGSGGSDAPPALFLAMAEPVGAMAELALDRDDWKQVQKDPIYRYRPPVRTDTKDGTT